MALRCVKIVGLLSVVTGLGACKGPEDGPSTAGTPPPAASAPACVISADCPNGQHCDLGECIQECNTQDPCTGELTCSPRARCLATGAPDVDPPPLTKFQGTVEAEPKVALLTERNKSLVLRLSSSSKEPVKYRVQVAAPHLQIDAPRGQFTGQTDIALSVNPSKLTGRNAPGSVKIFTTLGNIVVDAPIHVGLTGSYQGALRYDGGPVSLGEARLALDVLEKQGNVSVRVDSNRSLLFPPSDAGDATGSGTYTESDGLEFVVGQRVSATLGGDRNHFDRDLGRHIAFSLRPDANGNLQGSFEETLYGVFSKPIKLKGSAFFEFHSAPSDPSFMPAPEPEMPGASAAVPLSAQDVFGWQDADCGCLGVGPDHLVGCSQLVEAVDYRLGATLQVPRGSANPFTNIADACTKELAVTSAADYTSGSCALVPPLACTLAALSGASAANSRMATTFHRVLARTVAPILLVSQEHVVDGLYSSFTRGIATERSAYDDAMTSLHPVAHWVLQPSVLEFLKNTSMNDARGDVSATDPTATDYPAARALARLFFIESTIDGERARIAGSAPDSDRSSALRATQERALLTFFESAALLGVLQGWGSAPASVSSSLAAVLTPMDQGFAQLLNGAVLFGVPQGFVPFVYRPEDAAKGSTNFEQMMGLATSPLSRMKADEATFVEGKRQYEQNESSLRTELQNVRNAFDLRLGELCGSEFQWDAVTRPEDWAACGQNSGGEVGQLLLDIQQAQARLQSAESRILGMRDKIKIERDRIAQVQKVRADTIRFIKSNGEAVEAVMWQEGVVSAAQAALQAASQASITNFGAPAAMAPVAAMLELEKTRLEVSRQRLQTAQTMQFERANAQVEYLNGMAEIQKELIDSAQIEVDSQQEVLGVLQAQVRVKNSLEEAQRIWQERQRSLGNLDQSPNQDPTYRLLRDSEALELVRSRATAQQFLYLAGRALEYEVNTSIEPLPGAILAANNASKLNDLALCLDEIHSRSLIAFGAPQSYSSTVSIRKMLGITGPRKDEVTGETLTEGALFRRELLKNENLDGRGGVGLVFSTNLQPGNGLWSTDVCADKIAGIHAQIVGDFLGDNQAQINLSLNGGSVLRSCNADAVTTWSLGDGSGLGSNSFAVVQAGVNTFGDAPANSSLFGQSVARAEWRLVIPGGADAPSNSDLDLTKIDDVVLKIDHKALPRNARSSAPDFSCLSAISGAN